MKRQQILLVKKSEFMLLELLGNRLLAERLMQSGMSSLQTEDVQQADVQIQDKL